MNKVLNGLGIFFSVIIAIFLSVLFFSLMTIINIREFTGEKNLNKILNETDYSEFITEAVDDKTWNSLVDIAKTRNVTEEEVKSLMNSEHIKKLTSKYLNSLFESAVYESEVEFFTKDEFSLAFSKSIDTFNEENGKKIDNQTKAKILDIIEEVYDIITPELPSKESIQKYVESNDMVKTRDTYKMLVSSKTISYFAIGILILILVIALIRFSYYKWMFYVSTSLITSSIFLFILAYIIKIIDLDLDSTESFANNLITIIRNNIQNSVFITAFILMVIGIFGYVIHNHFKKSDKITTKEETLESN